MSWSTGGASGSDASDDVLFGLDDGPGGLAGSCDADWEGSVCHAVPGAYTSGGGATRSSDQEQSASAGNKRRAPQTVAEASKHARAKKRQEMELLREENVRLRGERAQFLLRIESLMAKVQEMREGGDVDVQIENELLKAQLEEHKNFVSALHKIAQGCPTSDLTRRRVYSQGANYAVTQVLSLLTRSVTEQRLWTPARLSERVLRQHPALCNIKAVYFRFVDDFRAVAPRTPLQSSASVASSPSSPSSPSSISSPPPSSPTPPSRRIHVRIDHLLPNASVDEVSAVYWNVWEDIDTMHRFFQGLDGGSYGQGDFELQHLIQDTIERQTSSALRPNAREEQKINISYVREPTLGEGKPEDAAAFVFCATKTRQEISRGALCLPDAWQQGEPAEPDSACMTCTVLARSTTVHYEAEAVPKRIKTHYVEGGALWALPGGRGCMMASALSIPEALEQRWISGAADVIAADGLVTDKFAQYIAGFVKLISMAGQQQLLLQQQRQHQHHQQPHEQQQHQHQQQQQQDRQLEGIQQPMMGLPLPRPPRQQLVAVEPKARAGRRASLGKRPVASQ
jgi:hypothetical protein